MSETKFLTTDNLDVMAEVIGEYINKRTDDITETASELITQQVNAKGDEISKDLAERYDMPINKMCDILKIKQEDTNIESLDSPRLLDIETNVNDIENVLSLSIDDESNIISNTLLDIYSRIDAISSGQVSPDNPNGSNGNQNGLTLTDEALAAQINKKTVYEKLFANTANFKNALLSSLNTNGGLNASSITSGTLSIDRIPSIPSSKITSVSHSKIAWPSQAADGSTQTYATINYANINKSIIKDCTLSSGSSWNLGESSGYIANNNLQWDTSGNITLGSGAGQFVSWANIKNDIDTNSSVFESIIERINIEGSGINGHTLKDRYLGKHKIVKILDGYTGSSETSDNYPGIILNNDFGPKISADGKIDPDIEYTVMQAINAEDDIIKYDWIGKEFNPKYVLKTNPNGTSSIERKKDDFGHYVVKTVQERFEDVETNWIGEGFKPSYASYTNNGVTTIINTTKNVQETFNIIKTDWIGEEFVPTYDTTTGNRTSDTVNDVFNKIKNDWIGIEMMPKYDSNGNRSSYTVYEHFTNAIDYVKTNWIGTSYGYGAEGGTNLIGKDISNIFATLENHNDHLSNIDTKIGTDKITGSIPESINKLRSDIYGNSSDPSTLSLSNLDGRVNTNTSAIATLQTNFSAMLSGSTTADAVAASLKALIESGKLENIEGIVTETQLTESLKSYVTTTDLNSKLDSYLDKTTASITYATIDTVNTKLNTSDFNTTMANYASKEDIKNFITKSDANGLYGTLSDMNVAKVSITGLQNKMDTAETNIAKLQTDVKDAETDIAKLQTDMDTAETNIAKLQTDVSAKTTKTDIQKMLADPGQEEWFVDLVSAIITEISKTHILTPNS